MHTDSPADGPADAPGATDAPSAPGPDARALAEQQRDEYLLLLKQTQAEFQNSQRRAARETETALKYANEKLVRDLLTALDNLDRAIAAAKQAGDTGALAQGVGATFTQLLDILKRYGIQPMPIAPGTAFDPNLHQAVMQQPSADHASGSIVQVLQQGFTLHDRVLRPASVIVAA
jgi:molecular chaperone GrpE